MIRFSILAVLVLLTVACSGSDSNPVAPTPPPPPPPACQANSTAELTLGNRSNVATYTAFLDGVSIATLGPGQNSAPRTVAAGVAHQVRFVYANTNVNACQPSSPVPATCSSQTITCAF